MTNIDNLLTIFVVFQDVGMNMKLDSSKHDASEGNLMDVDSLLHDNCTSKESVDVPSNNEANASQNILSNNKIETDNSNNSQHHSQNLKSDYLGNRNPYVMANVKNEVEIGDSVLVKEEQGNIEASNVSLTSNQIFNSAIQNVDNSSVIITSQMAIKDPSPSFAVSSNHMDLSDTQVHISGSSENVINSAIKLQNSEQVFLNTSSDAFTRSQLLGDTDMVVTNSQLLNNSQVHLSNSEDVDLDPSVLPEVVEGLQVLAAGGSGPAQVAAQELLDQTQFNTNIQQAHSSNNAYILPHSDSHFTLGSSKTAQGQVFLQQGNQLVAVSIPSTSNNSNTQMTMLPSGSHIVQPVMANTTQNSTPTKIVVQTNKRPPAENIATSQGHYVIQVGNSSNAKVSNSAANNRNHIVIRSNSNQSTTTLRPDPNASLPPSSKGVFKVIIPEGSTKQSRMHSTPQPTNETLRKHVQINLSNRASRQNNNAENTQQKMVHWDTGVQTAATNSDEDEYGNSPTRGKKLYECSNCNSKFMKPFYLRMHVRSCKKPEVKREKTPLFMCSFCKATFKTKAQVSSHFSQCFQSPHSNNNKSGGVKRKGNEESSSSSSTNLPKRGKHVDVDSSLEMAVQFKCQDCDRTFNKERQYTSHIKRCTKTSVHDLSGAKQEADETVEDDDAELQEDPFADIPVQPAKRGRSSGRRGRPPGRAASHQVKQPKTSALFEGEPIVPVTGGLLVADNEGLVRSTTGLAHTVQLTLETAAQEGQPQPTALVADSKGVRGREKPPQAWSLVCALCQKMFLTKPALANHMMTEHGSDLIYTRDVRMAKHKDVKQYFRCPMCELNYSSGEHLMEHLVLKHTSKLQETYTSLQSQTATYVCSLCSLVLLTRNLLMEHLGITHLEELESLAQCDSHVSMDNTSKQICDISNIKTENGLYYIFS